MVYVVVSFGAGEGMVMGIQVTAKKMLSVGRETVVESVSPEKPYAAVFEDDGQTGYFYALEPTDSENPIADALHIYNVDDVTDRDEPSEVMIAWSDDSETVILLINDCPHAVFDFAEKCGLCRNTFPLPEPDSPWRRCEWDESSVELLFE